MSKHDDWLAVLNASEGFYHVSLKEQFQNIVEYVNSIQISVKAEQVGFGIFWMTNYRPSTFSPNKVKTSEVAKANGIFCDVF